MRAYMKSAMPYYGVQTPEARAIFRRMFADVEFKDAEGWKRAVLVIWRGARYREERYGALYLTGVRAAAGLQTPEAMDLYEELIVTGAWWDYVDTVATQRICPILKAYSKPMRARMLEWSRSDDIWKRRTAILSQLKFKKDTDLAFLHACIEPSLGSKEFFLQKAIGWALREYAWVNPRAVKDYVRRHETRLAGLSRREALRNVYKYRRTEFARCKG